MSVTRVLIVASVLAIFGCKKEEAPAPAPAAKPVQTAAAPVSAKPAVAKTKKSLPAEKQPHPVPTEWTELTQPAKGFSFSVPKGSLDSSESKDGFDMYVAKLPKPNDDVQVMVVAYKDAKKTKEDLLKDAHKFLEVTGGKDVKAGEVKELNADYSLGEFTFLDADNKDEKTHARVLVATDVTDNYIMLVAAPEAHFKANEETIDTMWGSFDMFSGGASGESK